METLDVTISQQHLQAKRAALTASLEQIIGQANRLNGAIAVVDELIAEGKSLEDSYPDPQTFGGIDRETKPWWYNAAAQFDQAKTTVPISKDAPFFMPSSRREDTEDCPRSGAPCEHSCNALCSIEPINVAVQS